VIVDTSALVAIIRNEPERAEFTRALTQAGVRLSAANYLETGIVVDAAGLPAESARVDQLIKAFDIEIVPVTVDQARLARQAYRDFGNGSGHPAQLNFGDCFAYALAADTDEPLLFKGADFEHAGVRRVRSSEGNP
jgi:ribonuclease VapC